MSELNHWRRLPKISLHDHFEGGLRLESVIELSQADGLPLPTEDPMELRGWFDAQAATGDLVDYLKPFDYTVAVMQTANNLARLAREYVEDLVADGVVYGELRWAPEMLLGRGLSMDEAVEAVQHGLQEGMRQAAASGKTILVTQLMCAMRQFQNSVSVAELALRHRDKGVVGFDLAGPEAGYLPSLHQQALDLVAREFLPITLHAGEADGLDSIRSALVDGRALRLGHGVRISDDIDADGSVGRVGAFVRDRGIVLETSPTSNVHTAAFAERGAAMSDHPFDLLRRAGFRMSVNTDNRLMSRTNLSQEMDELAVAFGYGDEDFLEFTLNALDAAFVSVEERRRLTQMVREGYSDTTRPNLAG